MSNMTSSPVEIQTSPQSVPSTPSWLGEVAVVAHYLNSLGLLEKIALEVRFSRKRFGIYDTIDFICVLIGYTLSGEATLKDFYERLTPFAVPFMTLFGRSELPSRAALSRFLKALDQPAVEALRTLFEKDLIARPLREQGEATGGLWDRCGERWYVFDADGTRQVARQRALPATPDLPPAHRRMTAVCAPGYTGQKRGEVVRVRTTLLQAHTHQWMGTFGGAGNGDYRGELNRALQVITSYAACLALPLSQILVRLDGLYGNAAPLADVLKANVGLIARSKDYALLELEVVQKRLTRPADQECTHPESGTARALYDCLEVPLTPGGPRLRLVVATHPATSSPPSVGVQREGMVYELFVSTLPSPAFTAKDVLDLYLHRGSFETVLADEDSAQDPDRWCSHAPCGQECWQILSQWMWNLRLELGQHLSSPPMQTTEFAPV